MFPDVPRLRTLGKCSDKMGDKIESGKLWEHQIFTFSDLPMMACLWAFMYTFRKNNGKDFQ